MTTEEMIKQIRERLDRVVEGEHEIGNLVIALSIIAEIVEQLSEMMDTIKKESQS